MSCQKRLFGNIAPVISSVYEKLTLIAVPGKATFDEELTIPEAETARAKGIIIYSIGITDSISEDDLRYVYSIAFFLSLFSYHSVCI